MEMDHLKSRGSNIDEDEKGNVPILNEKRNDEDDGYNLDEDCVNPLYDSDASWSESSSNSSTSGSSSYCGSWEGFLLEKFPKYGSKEFNKLKNIVWPRFGLNNGQGYHGKPSTNIPDWTKKLDKDAKAKLTTKVSEEFRRLYPEQKYDTDQDEPEISRDEPEMSDEILRELCEMVSCTVDEIRELTKFVWHHDWLLFSDHHHPERWFDLVGNPAFAIELYTHGIVKGEKLRGVWALILTEAYQYEKQKGDQWKHRRRYQRFDGTAIRPIMTVYKEMRRVLGARAELVDLPFVTLPEEAFPDLKSKSYWKEEKQTKKRPLKIAFEILMLSDIDTRLQRFDCKFVIHWSWKQSLKGARLYYVKEQLGELDEASTDKEFLYKAEWDPPKFNIRNAVRKDQTDHKPPFVLNNDYSTLHSSETYQVTFSEKLELQNFPFDCQAFTMTFDLHGNDYHLTGKHKKFIEMNGGNFALGEWILPRNAVDCRIHRVTRRIDPSIVTIQFKMKRDPSSFVYKLVFTSFMICSATFAFFGTDVGDLAGRIAYIATMFLTGQAFQVVATAETPSLGYLTMIDYFLVISNMVIYLLLILSVFISLCASGENLQGDILEEGDPNDWVNIVCLVPSAFLYASYCIMWSLYARFIIIPKENSKLCSTPLKLDSGGFLYILSYLDDVPAENTTIIRQGNEREEHKHCDIDEDETRVTRIFGKIIEQGKQINLSYLLGSPLTGEGLSEAIRSFTEQGLVYRSQWKIVKITHHAHVHT